MALLAAATMHAALLGLAPHIFVPVVPVATPVALPFEIQVGSLTTFADNATPDTARAAASTQPVPYARSLSTMLRAVAARQAPTASESELPVPDDADGDEGSEAVRILPSAESAAPVRHIDIWRRSAADRVALLGEIETPPPSTLPSVGLLREGLAESDTLTGAARSSAAVAAAYEVARRHGPAAGVAVFELEADATGLVKTVRLSSAGTDYDGWRRMADGLEALLAKRRLRVPPGSKGMITRLRVERGELAVSLSERHRTQRKAALGQAPIHRKEESDESTRSSLEPGRLSPSLGIVISGAREAHPTRVVILSEQPL